MATDAPAATPAGARRVLVDANVLLDVLRDDPDWYEWSAAQLDACADGIELCINPIIYAEVSVGFERIEELDAALPAEAFTRLELPWEAGFLAGKAFLQYRRAKGERTSRKTDLDCVDVVTIRLLDGLICAVCHICIET